ncbi:MAG: tetratricopeptide repeat protein [Candidatus Micrarchaeia archaeon]
MSGFSLLNESKFVAAFKYANKAISLYDLPIFHVLRGYAEYELGDMNASIEDITKYIDSAGAKDAFAFKERGWAYQNLGEWSKSVADFEKAMELGDNSSELFHYLAISLANLEKNESAIEYFKKALSLDPNFEYAYSQEAKTLLKVGRFEEVVALVESARSRGIDNADLHLSNAVAYIGIGNYEKASAELLTVMVPSADFDSQAIELLGEIGNYVGIALIYMKWSNLYPNAPGFYKLQVEALTKAMQLIDEDEDAELYSNLENEIEEISSKYINAMDSEEEAWISFEDFGSIAKRLRGYYNGNSEELEEAFDSCERLIHKYPDMPGAYKIESSIIMKYISEHPGIINEKPELLETLLRNESTATSLLDENSKTAG